MRYTGNLPYYIVRWINLKCLINLHNFIITASVKKGFSTWITGKKLPYAWLLSCFNADWRVLTHQRLKAADTSVAGGCWHIRGWRLLTHQWLEGADAWHTRGWRLLLMSLEQDLQPLEDRHLIHHVGGDEVPKDSTGRLGLPPLHIDHPMKTRVPGDGSHRDHFGENL